MVLEGNKPKLWRPRISIRGLFVVTAFCAVLVAWWMDRATLKRTAEQLRGKATETAQLVRIQKTQIGIRERRIQTLKNEIRLLQTELLRRSRESYRRRQSDPALIPQDGDAKDDS